MSSTVTNIFFTILCNYYYTKGVLQSLQTHLRICPVKKGRFFFLFK